MSVVFSQKFHKQHMLNQSKVVSNHLPHNHISSSPEGRLYLLQMLYLADHLYAGLLDWAGQWVPVAEAQPNGTWIQINSCLQKLLQHADCVCMQLCMQTAALKAECRPQCASCGRTCEQE